MLRRISARLQNSSVMILVIVSSFGLVPMQLGAESSQSVYTLIEGDVITAQRWGARSLGVSQPTQLWSDGIIPYTVDAELTGKSQDAIQKAIEKWNELSVISLKPVEEILAADSSLSMATLDYVRFQPGEGCASWVGKRGGEQAIWVAPNCTVGSMMHEIGHVVGLEHEHTRPDRDQFITVHWENIIPEKQHNFDIASSASRSLGDYDYESIMHYGPTNFSIDGKTTISPLFGATGVIGQRVAPSRGDLEGVAQLYATDLSLVAHLYPIDNIWQAAIHVTNNQRQGAHDLMVEVAMDDAEITAYSNNGWACQPTQGNVSHCRLERLGAGELSTLLLNYNAGTKPERLTANLQSKTFDLNDSNNQSVSVASDDIPPAAAAVFRDDQVITTYSARISLLTLLLLLPLVFVRKSCLMRKLLNGIYR